MSITITQTAAKHVNEHLMSRGTGIGLRLGVKTTGCSGLAYVIEFADKVENDDKVI
jgi:iron-sulfur cluster assembly protein